MEEFPREPTPEEIERAIEELIEVIYSDEYSGLYYEFPELQDAEYDAIMEAKNGKDRVAAKKHLEDYVELLKSKKEQKDKDVS